MKLSEYELSIQTHLMCKLLEVLYMRRATMFRFIAETARILVIGNGGGIALTMGLLASAERVGVYHYLCMTMLLTFVLGITFSTITLFFVTAVTLKEAHTAEVSLHEFVHDANERDDVFFSDDKSVRRLANLAAGCGLISIVLLALGAVQGLVQVAIYF